LAYLYEIDTLFQLITYKYIWQMLRKWRQFVTIPHLTEDTWKQIAFEI